MIEDNTIRLTAIEVEMVALAAQLDGPDDNYPALTPTLNRMAELVDHAARIQSRTITQVVLKARIADAYNFHDPKAEPDLELAESIVRDLIRLAPELAPA